MPACTGCGASYEDSYKFCPYCGHVKPEPQKINIAVDFVPKKTAYDCPLCQDANHVQKVSAIVDSGTAEGVEHSKTSGSLELFNAKTGRKMSDGEMTATTRTNSYQQSKLAKKLKFPNPPQAPDTLYEVPVLWAIIIIMIIGFLITRITDNSGQASVCLGSVVLIVLVSIIAAVKSNMNESNKEYKKAVEDYQISLITYRKAQKLQKDLYYCHKHDVVFVSGKDEHAPADETWQACLHWSKDLVLDPEVEKKS